MFIEYLLNIEAFGLATSLLELHILAHLAAAALVILILRVIFFGVFKLLDEDLCVYFRKTRVWKNGATLFLRGLEVRFTQCVVEMAVAWHWGEDVGGFLWAATAPAGRDRGDRIAIGPDVLVFQVSV